MAAEPARYTRRYEGVGRGGTPWAADVLAERFLGPELFFKPSLYAGNHTGQCGGEGRMGWVAQHSAVGGPAVPVCCCCSLARQDACIVVASLLPARPSCADWRTPLPEVVDQVVQVGGQCVGGREETSPQSFTAPAISSPWLSEFLNPPPQACPIDCRRALYGNISLSGGTTMLKHFGSRIQRDLQRAVDARTGSAGSVGVTVRSHPMQRAAVWFGGSLLGVSPGFSDIGAAAGPLAEWWLGLAWAAGSAPRPPARLACAPPHPNLRPPHPL